MIRISSPAWLWRLVSGVALIIIALFDLLWAGEIGQFYCLPVAGLAFSDGWKGGLAAAVFCSVLVLAMPGGPAKIWVRWPGGRETTSDVPDGAREVVIEGDGAVKVTVAEN